MTNYSKETAELFMLTLINEGIEPAVHLVASMIAILEVECNVNISTSIVPLSDDIKKISVSLLHQCRKVMRQDPNGGVLIGLIASAAEQRIKTLSMNSASVMRGIEDGTISVMPIPKQKE